MPVPRYNRVLRGQRGDAAKKKYLDYLAGLNFEDKVGQGDPRPAIVTLYVRSFNLALPATVYMQVSASSTAWSKFKSKPSVSPRTKEELPNDATSIKVRGFVAARVHYREGVQASGTREVSRYTGLPYLDYGGKTLSVPFGRINPSDTFGLATAMLDPDFPDTDTSSVRYSEEQA